MITHSSTDGRIEPWPMLFQSHRATRETELTESSPSYVVTKWVGH